MRRGLLLFLFCGLSVAASPSVVSSGHGPAGSLANTAVREENNLKMTFEVTYKDQLIVPMVIGENGKPEASDKRWDTRWGKHSLERFAALRDKNPCIRNITKEIWSALYGSKGAELRHAIRQAGGGLDVILKLTGHSGDPGETWNSENACGLYLVEAQVTLHPPKAGSDNDYFDSLYGTKITSENLTTKVKSLVHQYESRLASAERKQDVKQAAKAKEDSELSNDPFFSTFEN